MGASPSAQPTWIIPNSDKLLLNCFLEAAYSEDIPADIRGHESSCGQLRHLVDLGPY